MARGVAGARGVCASRGLWKSCGLNSATLREDNDHCVEGHGSLCRALSCDPAQLFVRGRSLNAAISKMAGGETIGAYHVRLLNKVKKTGFLHLGTLRQLGLSKPASLPGPWKQEIERLPGLVLTDDYNIIKLDKKASRSTVGSAPDASASSISATSKPSATAKPSATLANLSSGVTSHQVGDYFLMHARHVIGTRWRDEEKAKQIELVPTGREWERGRKVVHANTQPTPTHTQTKHTE